MTLALAVQLVAAHKDAGLIEAHRHGERFHYAMSGALEAQREIDEGMAEYGTPEQYWVEKYQRMLGIAAAELQAMPAKWAAILTIDVKE